MSDLPHFGTALRMNARLFPDKIGARDLGRQMTFRQWNARSCRLANALIGLGLSKGDRLAVLAYNRIEWLEIYAATAKAGLVCVPVNFRLMAPEIRYIVENSEAKALIVEDALRDRIEALRDELPIPEANYICIGRCPGYREYEDVLEVGRDSEPDIAI